MHVFSVVEEEVDDDDDWPVAFELPSFFTLPVVVISSSDTSNCQNISLPTSSSSSKLGCQSSPTGFVPASSAFLDATIAARASIALDCGPP